MNPETRDVLKNTRLELEKLFAETQQDQIDFTFVFDVVCGVILAVLGDHRRLHQPPDPQCTTGGAAR